MRAVLCCVVLYCVVLCCAVLCCVVCVCVWKGWGVAVTVEAKFVVFEGD